MSFYGGRERTLESCEKMYITLLNRKQHLESQLSDAVNLNEKLSLKKQALYNEHEELKKTLASTINAFNEERVELKKQTASAEEQKTQADRAANRWRNQLLEAERQMEELHVKLKLSEEGRQVAAKEFSALEKKAASLEKTASEVDAYKQKVSAADNRAYLAEEAKAETNSKLAIVREELKDYKLKAYNSEKRVEEAVNHAKQICSKQCDDGPYAEKCSSNKCNVFNALKALGEKPGNR